MSRTIELNLERFRMDMAICELDMSEKSLHEAVVVTVDEEIQALGRAADPRPEPNEAPILDKVHFFVDSEGVVVLRTERMSARGVVYQYINHLAHDDGTRFAIYGLTTLVRTEDPDRQRAWVPGPNVGVSAFDGNRRVHVARMAEASAWLSGVVTLKIPVPERPVGMQGFALETLQDCVQGTTAVVDQIAVMRSLGRFDCPTHVITEGHGATRVENPVRTREDVDRLDDRGDGEWGSGTKSRS